ncbi:MAG: polymer-forming cytoskeletal protein [Chloroflexota bacterium]|nr:polymer-forming cytoskeletal protein [Chloroflexota bacterium]
MSFFSSRKSGDIPPVPAPTGERKPTIAVSAQQPVGFETVLGANSILEGHLRSSANVRLDGNFSGTLEISGNVLVGETARINADVNARNISIAGAVRGNVSGKKVQILRTGRVWGDIHAEALTTEEGAFIDGKITMTRPDMIDDAAPFGAAVTRTPEASAEPAVPTDAEVAPPTPDDKAAPTPAGGAEEKPTPSHDVPPTSAEVEAAAKVADDEREAADAAGLNEDDPYTPG